MTRRSLCLAGILLGMAASIAMQTLVATALPAIAGELGGMSLYSWVFAAYMLASTVTIPLFAKLADVMGRRALYLAGLAVFTGGSALAGMAGSMAELVAFRALQGIGAGAVGPAALAIVGDLFDASQRGRFLGLAGAVQVLASLVGPALGGWVTDSVGWRWGFFLVVPAGALAAAAVWLGLAERSRPSPGTPRRLDWPGSALLGAALGAGLLGFQAAGADGPGRAAGLTLALAAGLLLAGALRWESRHPDPVLPLGLLRRSELGPAAAGTLLLGAATYGAVVYIPLYVQTILGETATVAGAVLSPMLVAAGLSSVAGGWLAGRASGRFLTAAGWLLPMLALLWLALPGTGRGIATVTAAAVAVGLGAGLLLPVFLFTAQDTAGEAERAAASGVIQLARNLGGALCVPLLAVWLPRTPAQPLPPALSSIFLSLAGIAGLGLVLTRVRPGKSGQIHESPGLKQSMHQG